MQGSEFETVSFREIGEQDSGQRLDNYLFKHLKGVPKSRIYRLLRKGEVRVNKGRAKPDRQLQAGDSVRIPPIRVAERSAPPAPGQGLRTLLSDSVLFDDEALLIVNKPSGLAVHGGSGVSLGLIEALRANQLDGAYLELVHRLDRETSGCIVLARTRSALLSLHEQMKNGDITKQYQLLVSGKWPKGKTFVDAPLQKNQLKSGERIVRVDAEGKNSRTQFAISGRYDGATLLYATLDTGRTHQIRVHCQHAGHPIAGDQKYGDAEFNRRMKSTGLNRLFLHASRLRFRHPITGDQIEIDAPLPDDLKAVLRGLQ